MVPGAVVRNMNEQEAQTLTIAIGDQQFRIRVGADETDKVELYKQAEARAQRAYKALTDSGALGGPKTMVMAMFQIAVELEQLRVQLEEHGSAGRERISQLIEKIDKLTQ